MLVARAAPGAVCLEGTAGFLRRGRRRRSRGAVAAGVGLFTNLVAPLLQR